MLALLFLCSAAWAQESVSKEWGGTISLGVPHPVFIDVERRFGRNFSAALGAGGLGITVPGKTPIKLGIGGIDLRGRWHPFSGGFFLGLALGFQQIDGTAVDAIEVEDFGTVTTTATLKIKSAYLTPHFGWIWFKSSGFTIGFDFGWQFPFAPATELTVATDQALANNVVTLLQNTQKYKDLDQGVQDTGNKVGVLKFPYFTVLRLGWMF